MSAIHVLAVFRHPVGGIRTYVKYVYGRLSREEFQFTLVQPDFDEERITEKELSGHQPNLVDVPASHIFFRLAATTRRLALSGKYRVIHAHGLTAAAAAALGLAGVKVPLIITPHDIFRPSQTKGLSGFLKKRALGWVFKKAAVIQCVGEDQKENLLLNFPQLKKTPEKIRVIRNGIETSNFSFDIIHPSEETPSGPLILGFLGRFMEQKGFLVLLKAIENLHNEGFSSQTLQILAINDGAYIREYKEEINRKNLQEFFEFRGFLPNVGEIFPRLDAVVIPSLWEACPLLPMEALCAGLPVLGSDCIGLKEVLKGTPALIHPTGDARALADSIKIFQREKKGLFLESQKFRGEAKEAFSVQKTSDGLNRLFKEFDT